MDESTPSTSSSPRETSDRRPAASSVEWIRATLETTGRAWLRVHGESMLPFLRGGDILLVRRMNPLRVYPREILLYTRNGRLFAHRLQEKWWQDGHLMLAAKGDALPYTDPPVLGEECLGLVVAVCRDGRFLNPASLFGRLSVHFLSFLPGGSSWLYWLTRLWRRLAPRGPVPEAETLDALPVSD